MPSALLVFSHLRWDFVYQRPQHLLSRIARHCPVWYVEEPVADGPPRIETLAVAPGVTVCRPHIEHPSPAGFHDEHLPMLQELLQQFVSEQLPPDYAVWFYTPMALPLINGLEPRAVIYDCMDELSAFMNAPRQLVQRESALLRRADAVFTGGRSLYRAKRKHGAAVHCFPSGVDATHYRQVRGSRAESPQAAIPRPRLGYLGVIDERVDLELIAAVADAHPTWQLVMVGPIVKIDAATVPRRPNIHYLGQQRYEDLPALVAEWDVCLLPFALNDATRFISPTKTLEYMAAGKPIVGTPVPDLVECHGDLVSIATGAAAFAGACQAMMRRTPAQRGALETAMAERVAESSWDRIAEQMLEVVSRLDPGSDGAPRPTRESVPEYQEIVIGAGPTGLSAALHLGKGSLLLEANDTVGGWCRSIRDHGFTFDYAGHIMFSNDPYVLQMYRRLLGDNVHWQNREAWIYSKGVYTRYPFQGALYGLPPNVLKECIVGAIEARFGPLREPSAPVQRASGGKAESITDCCADGIAESTVACLAAGRPTPGATAEPENFEQFIYRTWGRGIAKHFAIPYNRKLWAVPLTEMETSWLGGRVPLPDLEEMIEGALRPVAKPMGPNARFGYPLRGGFQALMNGFLPLLRGELQLNARVVEVQPSAHLVRLADGRRYRYRHLVSTAPLPVLIRMIGNEAPAAVRAAVEKLRFVSVRCVNLGVGRPQITDKHWIYYPEDTVFHRIFVQGNASSHCNPPGGFGLTCEITYGPNKPLPCDGEALVQRCIDDCVRTGLLRADDPILTSNQIDMPYAYVIYDHQRAASCELIRRWLEQHDIVPAGRYAQWQYYNSDHAFIAGKQAAEAVRGSDAETADVSADADAM